MDLNTITAVSHPQTRSDLPVWTPGDAWLAGGTWLFSEPQIHLTRLIDLTDLKWPALTITDSHFSIAATCTISQLDAFTCPPDWLAAPLISPRLPGNRSGAGDESGSFVTLQCARPRMWRNW